MDKNVLGLDLSISGTGIAVLDADTDRLVHLQLVGFDSSKGSRIERCAWIAEVICVVVHQYRPQLIMIEDYAYSRANTAALGELGGVVKLELMRETSVPNCWLELNITQWKNWAIGMSRGGKKGKADSLREARPWMEVYDQNVRALTGKEWCNDNLADSIHISRYGAAHYASQFA